MNIKLQGLLNAAEHVEKTYGRAALEQTLATVSPSIRHRVEAEIAINWHPMEELVEFIRAAANVVGEAPLKLAEDVGAAGAKKNLSGSLKTALFMIAKPAFLVRHTAGLWSQFNDRGTMDPVHVERDFMVIEIRGVPDPNVLFCATLTGWWRVAGERFRARNAEVRHVECRARGGDRCLWNLRWAGFERR